MDIEVVFATVKARSVISKFIECKFRTLQYINWQLISGCIHGRRTYKILFLFKSESKIEVERTKHLRGDVKGEGSNLDSIHVN